MKDVNVKLLITGAVAYFIKDLIAKILWSLLLYLTRDDLNHDNDKYTPDKFLRQNPYTDSISERYIIKYTIAGVHWGFFHNDRWVHKFSFWLDWAEDRENRYPIGIKTDRISEETIVKLMRNRK